jgi:hypothetical protein
MLIHLTHDIRHLIKLSFNTPKSTRGLDTLSSPKEAVFEKPEESSQHLKPLYIRGHIDGKRISRMLIDGGTTVNLMSYTIFKKLGWEDDELMNTNLRLNGMGGGGATRWRPEASSPWSSP